MIEVISAPVLGVVSAIAGAVGYSLTGYMKSAKNGETFEWNKFFRTASIGTAIGLYGYIAGVSPASAVEVMKQTSIYGFVTAISENVVKFFERWYNSSKQK